MKKFNFIFSPQTLVVGLIALLSSFVALHYQLSMYVDFLIVGFIIAFPISFTLREAFRRREKALEYMSLFKASLQSIHYCFECSDLEQDKKIEIKHILVNTSSEMMQYLASRDGDFLSSQQLSSRIFSFIRDNDKDLKKSFTVKVLLFLARTNESIAFLSAAKRHHTPWAIRFIILAGVYLFVIFYPASLLSYTGFQVSWWYVFSMTFFKGLIFISLYNIQNFLVEPFNQQGADGVKLEDFAFNGLTVVNPTSPSLP
jgi:hypothetical protein